MLINGEKYACEACVRGHRVSTCQHHDRQLTHINKKGRPVSQCPHCRGLRKARATHTACECGSKPHGKDDCADNSDVKSDYAESHSDTASDPGAAEQRSCCCSHGMRCTCALKKDPYLDTVPELDPPLLTRKRASSGGKPRLLKAGSDNGLTVFTNGHHRPVHKHNDAAHKCGMPYKIPIPHSIHGNADVARRSTDSLPLMRAKAESHPQLQDTFNTARQVPRMARSEHGSPEPRASFFRQEKIGAVPPLDLSYPAMNERVPPRFSDSYRSSPQPQELYYDPQEEPPLLSADLNSAPVEWSDLSIPYNNPSYSNGFSQPPSYISLENLNTGPQCFPTSSSGEGSDTASDYLSYNANSGSPFRTELAATSSTDVRSINRLSSSSFTSIPPAASSLSPSNAIKAEPDFHPTSASPTDFQDPHSLHADAFERHGLTVHDVQKMAHPETPTEAMSSLSLPLKSDDINRALWGHRLDPPMDTLVPPDLIDVIGVASTSWQ